MNSGQWAERLPGFLRRQILHFESTIEDALRAFAETLPDGSLLLDAGAGEGQYKKIFSRHRYVGVDLGIGDRNWNYSGLDCIADLARLPFPAGSFAAAINIVTLEHVPEPAKALSEISRVLQKGGRMLLLTTEDNFSGAWTSRVWYCRTYNRQELMGLCEGYGLHWKNEQWFTPVHKAIRAGGICVEIEKQ